MQREFERLLGSPLTGIRIHTDPAAAELAASEHASAFTIGRDIVFGKDRFAPGTQRGRMLLAHELAHTIQQSSRGAFAAPSASETEARAAGSAVAQGRPGLVQSAAPVAVQREDDDDIRKRAKPPSKPKAKGKPGRKKSKKPAAKPWTSKRAKASTASTASKREKTMAGMTPEQRRQVEVLEQYAEGAEKAGKDRIGRTPGEEEGVARTRRKEKSEKQRHVDPMKRVSGHHGFPQYLGGKFEQTLISLGEDLHYLYHQELDLVEKVPRKLGSNYYKNLPPAERDELFRRLLKHAEDFDRRYSKRYPDKRTRIAAALKRGIREAGFKVPSTRKQSKAGTGRKKGKGRPGGRPAAKPTKAKPARKAKKPKAERPPKAGSKPKSTIKPSTPKPTLPSSSAGSTPARAGVAPSASSPGPSRIKPALKIGAGMIVSMAVFWWLGNRAAEEEEESRNKLLARSVDPEVEKFLAANQAEAIRLTTENPMAPVYLNVTADFDFTWERQGAAGTPTDEHVTDIRFQGIALSQENIRKQQTISHESFGGFTGNTTIWETRHITYSIEVDFGETEEELHGRRLLHDASRIARRGISARSVGEGTHWGGKDLKAWERRQDDERRRWGLPTLEEQRAYDERQRWVEAYVEYTAFHGPDDLYADAVRYLEEIKRRPRPIPGEVLRPR